MRAATTVDRISMVWGAVGLAPAVVAAIVIALKQTPQHAALSALLDNYNSAGGLLMVGQVTNLGAWQDRLQAVSLPQIRWRNPRIIGVFFVALLFLAISFVAPVHFSALGLTQPLEIAPEVERIADQIDTLKEERIIQPDTAESLEEKLDEVRGEASGEDPARTWEALDHLNDTISKTARETTEELAKELEQFASTQALAEALAKDGGDLDNSLLTEAMHELSDQAEAMAQENKAFKDSLSSETVDGLKSGKLTREQMKELAAMLDKSRAAIRGKLEKLRELKLIDAETLQKCENAGKCDATGLAAFLAENGDEKSVDELMAIWAQSERSGKGGIARGRGDAPMTWADPTSEEGAKFKEQILSPSALAGFKDSRLVGRSVGAPSVENGGTARIGALANAANGKGSANTQSVLPRHKSAVKRYFEKQ
jgi:hypothetical protein